MIIIGVGNCGMVLASKFSTDPILISTAHQDTVNFEDKEVYSFSKEGASKRFRTGVKIWENNIAKLKDIFEDVRDEKVVIFSSFGGGSGSSSLNPLSRILLSNNNKVLIVGVLPFKKEINPPLANSVQSINSLMTLIQHISVLIFDNEKLKKEFKNNWNDINDYIIKRVDYIVNLLDKFSTDQYSPLTLDQSELDSVVFGGGFIDFSNDFIEEKMPKLEYGKIDKETKNCLIAMFVDTDIEDEEMSKYHNVITNVVDRVSSKISNARMIPGILRGSVNYSNAKEGEIKDRAYITIASGLNIEKYIQKIEKIRDLAVKKATAYAEDYRGSKFIDKSDNKVLDI